jgi:hypothetical protein
MALEQLTLLVLPPLVLLALALWLLWPWLRCWYLRRDLEKRIAALGERHLRDVMLEDGMGGHSYFEWLLLTGEGICLLNTSQRDGNIFAGERMENWAQVVGSRSRQFVNPLFALEPLTATLRYHLPGTPLQAVVLFSGRCHFPKGRPEAVLTRDELPAKFELRNIPLTLQRAWEQLQDKVRPLDPHSEGHLLPYREGPGAWRVWLALVLLGISALWLLWRVWLF